MAGSPLVLLKSIKDSMGHLEKGDRFFMNGPMIFPVRSHNGNTCPHGQEQRSHHVKFSLWRNVLRFPPVVAYEPSETDSWFSA